MEAFKAEIIKEVRKEFQKMKQEIIDGTDISISREFFSQKFFGTCETLYIFSRKNRTEQEIKKIMKRRR